MAQSMNAVTLVGRLTRDPEMRHTSGGIAVTTITLAIDRPYSKKKETDFIDVIVWNKRAEVVNQFMTKGRLIGVTGKLQSSSYNDSDGIRRKAVRVVADDVQFLDKAPVQTQEEAPPQQQQSRNKQQRRAK